MDSSIHFLSHLLLCGRPWVLFGLTSSWYLDYWSESHLNSQTVSFAHNFFSSRSFSPSCTLTPVYCVWSGTIALLVLLFISCYQIVHSDRQQMYWFVGICVIRLSNTFNYPSAWILSFCIDLHFIFIQSWLLQFAPSSAFMHLFSTLALPFFS